DEDWAEAYEPIKTIDPNIYNPLLKPIGNEELLNMIKSAPLGKATGPSGIANEALQHLPQSAINRLKNILNDCLRLNK
ncbi:15597_t:CDS:1, partial [Gigaspora rosea]